MLVDVDDAREKRRVIDAFRASSASTQDMASAIKKPSQSPYERQAEASKKAKEDIAAAFKKEPAPDAKEKAAKESRERLQERLDKIKEERESYHKATGHKYDTERGTKEDRARARQRIKAGEYQSDAKAEMWEVEHHPIASSAARGALSGTTLGASELVAQKSKKRKESGAEEYYQKNKNKTAETVGEIAGSLATFGATAGATGEAAAKLTSKVAPRAAERLAEKEIIKNAAKRSVNKAVKKGLVGEASEELIRQVGKDKAKKIVGALGTDIVQNLTTAAVYDINRASTEREVGSKEWWGELGKSAALNFGVTGAIAGASSLSGGKRLATEAATKIDMRRGLRELADSRAGASKIQAPRIGESIEDRIARMDAERLGARVGDSAEEAAVKSDAPLREVIDDAIKTAESVNRTVIGNGKRVFTFEIGESPFNEGHKEIITVRANRASEAADLASEYGISNGMGWSQNVTNRPRMAEPTARAVGEATDAVRSVDEAVEATAFWRDGLADADDFEGYIYANRKNPDVRAFVESEGIDGLEKLWRDTRIAKHKQNIHEISLEEADDVVSRALPNSTRLEWFQNQNSKIKPKLAHYIARDPDLVNAGLNVAYRNYADPMLGTPMSFDEWLVTPQKMYRGTHGQELLDDDIFSAFTLDRRVAEKFAGKSKDAHIEEITVRPIDTYGGYNISGEQEILVPQSVIDEAKTAQAVGQNVDEAVEAAAKAEAFDAQAYRESLDDVIPFTSDTPTAPKRGLPKSHKSKEENVQGLLERDDVPFATVDDSMPSTNPELTAENELRDGLERRVEQLGKQEANSADDTIKVNDVATDRPVSESMPSGVKQIRSAYDYNNGERIEDGIKTRWNEAWNASRDYSASHAKGERVRMSKVAVSELNAMDSDAERALRERLVENGDMNYEAISTPEMYDKIAKQMRDDADRWVKEMIDINEGGALDFRSTPEWQARVQYILGTVDPSADEASEIAYTEAFKLAQNISSKGGQVLNLRRNFVHLTELGKRDAILDDFINILEKSKGFSKNHPAMNNLMKFDRRNYIRKYLMDDEGIRDGLDKLVKAEKLDDVSEAFTELMIKVNQKNPKSAYDVLQELRYLNMLGNPKTHIRNVFGSGFFAPMRQISNAIRAGIEDPIVASASKKAGVKMEITKHGGLSLEAAKEAWVKNPTTEAGKSALEAFERMKTEILGSAKYETPTYTGRGKTVAGKTLDAVSDFNAMLLSKEDDFFRSRAFRENYIKSYNRYLKDGKPITNKVKKMIEQEALKESQIATFNEYNEFARMLNRAQSKANDATAAGWQRWTGRAANAAMPFTKVPANLMKQSVNYSPLGLMRGMAGIKAAAKKGDAALLNKAIDELSSGLTGSAVFGLGMLLGKTTHNMFGVEVNATTNTGKNDDAAKFKKDRGMQNYSITFKDPETGQGHSFTLDWLVPTSATFFSGVEFADQLKKGELGLSAFADWSTVVSRLAEPVMETSMLSGLHGMLETLRGGSRSDDDKGALDILIRELGQSYLNSIIPTLSGQAARTAYKTDMQIVGDTDWEYWRNQMKSKAGLANTKILGEPLGADTDVYGNVKGEKKSAEDYVKSGLKNFLSPANIQKVDFSEVDKQKLAEYERAVKNGADPSEMAYLFPKKQYKKQFKVGGEEIKMSNRDLSTYNQAKATGGEEGMRVALESIMFNRRTTDENGKNVPRDDAYTDEQKSALMEQFKGKSIREVEQWLYKQPEFKNATPAERKRVINSLWSLDSAFDSKAVGSRRVGEQAVILAQGGDVNEYNFKNEVTEKKREELMPAIEAGILTYEQAVDFNRNAAKMGYYETEDGGYSRASYNRETILNYLENLDASEETKKALYDAYYTGKTPYGVPISRGRRGYGRRYGGYRRYGGGGGSKKAPAIKQSDFKAGKGAYKDIAAPLKSAPRRSSSTASTVKIEPPKVKFKKYEV